MKLLRSAVLLAVAVPSIALAGEWEIDTSHSSATFAVKHMMVSNVRGEFGTVAGVLNLDEKDITRSTVQATIDARTINTRDAKRDGHLKSDAFFDVAKHPNITFKSTKVTQTAPGKLAVLGDLTIRGVTKAVTLDVEAPNTEAKDPWGNIKRGVSASTKLNRKDFGLSWNQALETGGVLVGDEVGINLDIELNKKKAPAPAGPAAKK